MLVVLCLASCLFTQSFGFSVWSVKSDEEAEKEVSFWLHNQDNLEGSEVTKSNETLLTASKFDPTKKTKVVIHGYLNNRKSAASAEVVEAYLDNQDVNVMTVDWSGLAGPLYNTAVDNTLWVGKQAALMIDFLVSTGGANISDFHLIGHSCGSHIAGFTANYVTSGNITRITGMDPAQPLFDGLPIEKRLDSDDADVVDCIHTSGGILGFWSDLCTHDFYPNGGTAIQPGCGFDLIAACSHGRSAELFAASISHNFTAQACASCTEVQKKKCTGEWTGLMGELAPSSPAGIYYLKTTGSYPYTV